MPKRLSLWKQPGLPTPFAWLGPQHPVLCMECMERQDLKHTTLIANMVVNGNMNVLEHSGCSVNPLTWKSLLAKLLFLNIKITGVILSPSLFVLILSAFLRSLLWQVTFWVTPGPPATPFLSWDVPNKSGSLRQEADGKGEKVCKGHFCYIMLGMRPASISLGDNYWPITAE